jgi:anti-sigma-K factor RskA
MNPQENQDWERKLQELDAQINQSNPPSPTIETEPGQPLQVQTKESQSIQPLFNKIANWFQGLPGAGKVAVVAVAALVGFGLLRSVLYLVASLISLGILAGLVYLAYKLFIAPKSPD